MVARAMDDQTAHYTVRRWTLSTCYIWAGSVHRGLSGADAPRMRSIRLVSQVSNNLTIVLRMLTGTIVIQVYSPTHPS
jgi:hypothetical protein